MTRHAGAAAAPAAATIVVSCCHIKSCLVACMSFNSNGAGAASSLLPGLSMPMARAPPLAHPTTALLPSRYKNRKAFIVRREDVGGELLQDPGWLLSVYSSDVDRRTVVESRVAKGMSKAHKHMPSTSEATKSRRIPCPLYEQ